ncbi:hexapeptide repeat of succinyl-transferase family protein [Francisella philomiragia]|uniref:hypothetical protein n=1 Tax=Francisella philomiragia TaxID=28110 RepID=UPI0005A58386|nr:hypothetical protein [Francisella philomiragia]AJI57730.1 hexapeptide repeat of succinyl-transferase family protein [Francisella philomiragia]MBK2106393.1 hypothetical protein [Francisella philomiragia]
MLLNLRDYIDNQNIIREGKFSSLGSAKSKSNKNLLCYALSTEYIEIANTSDNISVVITTPKYHKQVSQSKGLVIHGEPDILYAKLNNRLVLDGKNRPQMKFYIDKTANIHNTAIVSHKVWIGKNVQIGKNCIINDYSIISDNSIIEDNVVIGANGSYYKRMANNKLLRVFHAGGVYIGKDVDILANSIIQKAHDADFTYIGDGTKISVNVNVGHSSTIGKHNIITGNVQIAGRVEMGDCCWIGTSATISDSVKIGDFAKVRVGSVVVKDVAAGEQVSGNFAYSHTRRIRNFAKEQREK